MLFRCFIPCTSFLSSFLFNTCLNGFNDSLSSGGGGLVANDARFAVHEILEDGRLKLVHTGRSG